MERLDCEVKRLQAENEQLRGELGALKTAPQPMATTQATYFPVTGMGMRTGSQYGSPFPSSLIPPGQFALGAIPYQMAANQAASPGQIGHVPGYTYMQPPRAHQFQGSPQQQGGMAMLQPPAPGTETQGPLDATIPVTSTSSSG